MTTEKENFEDMLENYLRPEVNEEETGTIKQGKIVHIGNDVVLVDIGLKSEGQIPISEFMNAFQKVTVQEGDIIDVLLLRNNTKDGRVILSYERAKNQKVFEILDKAMETGEILQGVIARRVKGGYAVDFLNTELFLPGSHVDLRPVRDMDSLLGKEIEFVVLKVNKKRSNAIVSRRTVLEKEREQQREQIINTLEEGNIVTGVVKTVTEYGAFVDLGGIDGLLHITDLAWKRVKHAKDIVNVGDEITVKILAFDKENNKLSLGLKQLREDPWLTIEKDFPVGTLITGKVTNITDYGAFVELRDEIEGLVHISEMSWTRKLRHPTQIIKIGDVIEAVVLEVSTEKKRIALGMKQTKENPWDIVEASFPVGTVIEGVIKSITDFGIFVGIEDGIDGLIHVSDISWVKKIKNPKDIYSIGDVIQAQVILVDKENEKFTLGIKQLEEDPWLSVGVKYPVGCIVEGVISNLTDFGIFVEVEEGIEGLVHISEIHTTKVDNPTSLYSIGDSVQVKVIHSTVTQDERKLGLSIKRCLEEEQDKESDAKQSSSPHVTFADLMKDKLQQR
ncbi:MAG: 30S ribosomal protein S1 [Desulfovibrionaceae bacterium]|nr:30S ribosomal protein S1 [Desulfovibrionaceae bacterium]